MRGASVAAAWAALTLGAGTAGAAGVVITVTHDLDAARPAAVIAVPFRDIAALAPDLRMYHVIVRDPKGRALPAQITNYQHDHRGASYDDLVFAYDFAAGEKRAVFTLESSATATPPDAPCVYARTVPERSRRHGLGERSHRASHVRPRAQHARGGRRTPARQRHRRLGQARQLSDRRSLVCQGPRSVPQGRRRRRPRSVQHRRLARRRRHGRMGWHQTLDLRQFHAARRCCRTGRGARRSASRMRPWDAGAAGKVQETKQFTVDCGRNFDAVESTFDFGIGRRRWSASASPSIRRRRVFRKRVLTQGSRRPLDELLGREQGWRPRDCGDPRPPTASPRDLRTRRPRNRRATAITCCWSRRATACRCATSPAPAGTGAASSPIAPPGRPTCKAFAAAVANPLKITVSARP